MKRLFFTTAIAALLTAAPASAESGDWLVRLRAINVAPNESADIATIGGDVDIDTSVVPELDITYFVRDQWAVELILGVTPHDVTAVGTSLGDVDLGDVTLLPPTLTLQYHFNPQGQVRPYVGAGVNYTHFFDADLPAGSALTSIDYDASFGLAAQAGVDFALDDDWFVNVDVKYIDIDTDVTINGAIAADVQIDPVVFGIGLGRRF
ncbi:MAG: outer membrane protein [Maricaulis maris]|jgi:outer membrane protein|uniref:OmpW family protein n=1 Tax=Maricaulis maris (strain MCS10) TaxID=394221 RepID=Q0AS49_MARMM|nr:MULTISPECIES: OmpW family protein [Maricaulis]ABI64888.1 OmpW family protein [Maricaulis maris MCS10]MAC90833.1 OmpW family protein [Maricaulis sp.]